ncbi:anaerobic ribonucleoside-triphosphate reductase activating protein [Pseudodesulfovibrio senegalensis]|uniref:Anaerobic ribonucleoside-triphosphate reductase activating protein n=1 Tax=Pseudodesulfovibrio senegalensis TaxID=1721087 RepID=A0A6N6N3N9_9BACT|nr:anaerobic ribonucleoside-triphosphate reductase activating protein [Pseudodesulfovibrio senegalensis]KAB1442455.1 anaerobic ribonucleoside-triphosphate reductase activating protein [Pseudodesulfovibrio senegalensis]
MGTTSSVWDYVRGFEHFSLCDWPGRTSCVFFLGGCNLRCPTCHNYKLAWHMNEVPVVPENDLRIFLRDRAKWLDGVTVTGGEPSCVPGLGELLYEIRKFDLPVKMDSNGMRPEVVRDILDAGLADVFAVDVKGPYSKYPELTGHAVSEVTARTRLEEIFAMARQHPDSFYFRLTKVPGITDADIEEARSYLPEGFELKLQDFVPPRRRTEDAQPDNETRRAVGNVVD